jgi:Fe-S-cluster containining protein
LKKTLKLFASYGRELKKVHFALSGGNDDISKLNELYETLPKFKGKSCLFLINGSCSIYDVRPGKCRSQGYSLVQIGNNVQIQSCVPEISKFEKIFEKQGSRKVLMPLWNDYEKKDSDFE